MSDIAEKKEPLPEKLAKKSLKKFDPHAYIPVRNGFQGKLVYVNKRTGEEYIWDSYGDVQEIELVELKNAKGSSKSFYINNWWLFDNQEITDYLGVSQYYKDSVDIDDLALVYKQAFEKGQGGLNELVLRIPNGQYDSVLIKTRQLIERGEIDSLKLIKALGNAFKTTFVET